MWPHVLRSEVGSCFPCFLSCNWLIFCFFSYVAVVHLIKIREGFGIHCKLIPGWTKLTPSRILFPPPIQNQFRNNTWRSISKLNYINQTTSLTNTRSLTETASIFFSTIFFSMPYYPIYKTYSTWMMLLKKRFHNFICLLKIICSKLHQLFIRIVLFLWAWPSYLNLQYSKWTKK